MNGKPAKTKPIKELFSWTACSIALLVYVLSTTILLQSNDIETNPGPECNCNNEGFNRILFYVLGIHNKLDAYWKNHQDIQNKVEEKMNKHESLLEQFELRNRQNNIRFIGVTEEDIDCIPSLDKVVKMLNSYSKDPQWKFSDISYAYRVGEWNQRNSKYPRPLVVSFRSAEDKAFILRDRKLRRDLKDKEGIKLAADLTPKQQEDLNHYRDLGFTAYYKQGHLHVEDEQGNDPRYQGPNLNNQTGYGFNNITENHLSRNELSSENNYKYNSQNNTADDIANTNPYLGRDNDPHYLTQQNAKFNDSHSYNQNKTSSQRHSYEGYATNIKRPMRNIDEKEHDYNFTYSNGQENRLISERIKTNNEPFFGQGFRNGQAHQYLNPMTHQGPYQPNYHQNQPPLPPYYSLEPHSKPRHDHYEAMEMGHLRSPLTIYPKPNELVDASLVSSVPSNYTEQFQYPFQQQKSDNEDTSTLKNPNMTDTTAKTDYLSFTEKGESKIDSKMQKQTDPYNASGARPKDLQTKTDKKWTFNFQLPIVDNDSSKPNSTFTKNADELREDNSKTYQNSNSQSQNSKATTFKPSTGTSKNLQKTGLLHVVDIAPTDGLKKQTCFEEISNKTQPGKEQGTATQGLYEGSKPKLETKANTQKEKAESADADTDFHDASDQLFAELNETTILAACAAPLGQSNDTAKEGPINEPGPPKDASSPKTLQEDSTQTQNGPSTTVTPETCSNKTTESSEKSALPVTNMTTNPNEVTESKENVEPKLNTDAESSNQSPKATEVDSKVDNKNKASQLTHLDPSNKQDKSSESVNKPNASDTRANTKTTYLRRNSLPSDLTKNSKVKQMNLTSTRQATASSKTKTKSTENKQIENDPNQPTLSQVLRPRKASQK